MQAGGEAVERSELVEHVMEATSGPARIDAEEARRAHGLGHAAADLKLRALIKDVRKEHGEDAAIQPEIVDLGLAWVRAV